MIKIIIISTVAFILGLYLFLYTKYGQEESKEADSNKSNMLHLYFKDAEGFTSPAYLSAVSGLIFLFATIFSYDITSHDESLILTSFVGVFVHYNRTFQDYVRIQDGYLSIYQGPFLSRITFSLDSLFRVQLTEKHIRFYQANKELGKVHLRILSDEDIQRLKSEIEAHIAIKQ